MSFQAGASLPAARSTDLVTTSTADSLLIYDQDRHELHTLNTVAATVWRLLDGQRTADDVLREASADLGVALTMETVQLAVATLAEAHLLDTQVDPGTFTPGSSRRRLLKKASVLAAAPVVVSISAPLAAQANSTTAATCGEAVAKYGCANECSMATEGMLSCQQWQSSKPCKVCVNTSIGGKDRPWDYQWNSCWRGVNDYAC